MQVRVSEDGHLVIPMPIRQQLGIVPGTWLEIDVDHGILHASVIQQSHSEQTATTIPTSSRLAALKPHPDAVDGSDEDLVQVKVWDESEWEKSWSL